MADRDTRLRRMTVPLSERVLQEIVQTLDENSILLDSKVYRFRNGCILKSTGAEGCISAHLASIQEILWYHQSRKDRCYFLAQTSIGYLYVSLDLEYLDFLEIAVKLYLSQSREELIQQAMSDAAYKRYMKYTVPVVPTDDDEVAV